MEVVEADDGGHVGDEGVGLAADVVELALATEAGRHAAHEGRLAAARVSRQACIHTRACASDWKDLVSRLMQFL